MDGALMEVGPFLLQDNHTLRTNAGSWNQFANLLFVDNPLGTGFSIIDSDSYLAELPQMADQFLTFLDKWLAIFPEYVDNDV